MNIRMENPGDYERVNEVVARAFATAEHSDGNEQELVAALRKSDAFIPQLSLVAEIGDEIVGHILFTQIQIGGQTALALAPLSVLPENQRQGVGQALMAEGHRIARELGYSYAVVLGSERYYPKAGYGPASQYGITAPFEVPDENFMAIRLDDQAGAVNGVVEYAKEFGI